MPSVSSVVKNSEPSARVIASETEALAVAREVAALLAPEAIARDRERRKPLAELDLLSARGLLALTVPRSHGGADVSAQTLVQVYQILAAADPAVAQLPQSHFVFLNALREDGTAAQHDFFYPRILAGARLGNAQAERGSSSALDLKTRLLPDPAAPGTYLLTGVKHYTTGALFAHWLPVAAIDDAGRLVLAYVPRETSGVELLDDWNALGQRSTYSGTARFTSVPVPAAHVVAHWQLFDRPATFHSFAQLLHAAIDVGIAQNALADTLASLRARQRPRLGAPVPRSTEDPLILHRLGQLHTKFHAAEALLLRAARAHDQAGPRPTAEAAAQAAVYAGEAKAYAEDVSVEIASELFALLGTSAADESLDLDRHWRNARVHSVHDANQWRYHASGNWFLNQIAPAKPVRRAASETPAPTP
ncbi:MAG: SfnB family sulfur acquisition oxidoreductase [Verrucomicrobia bacterium]|nr:SfnB family sulfur acquisition oxidoreductase [Verrucomicrobiota bacterium]